MKLTKTLKVSALIALASTLALGSACTPSFNDSGNGGASNSSCDQDNDGHNRPGCDDDSDREDDDCDDNSALRFPGNKEKCDGVDNNCANGPDEGTTCGGNVTNCDKDGDNHCSPGCNDGSGKPQDDCDDNDPGNFPGNSETCDQRDNNCNGAPDDGITCGCQSCNGSTGNGNPVTTTGGGSNNATCQVQLNLSGMQSSGAIYAFGEFQDGNYIPFEAHWAAVNACSPNAQGSLCQFSGGACGFTVKNNSYVLMQVSAQDSSVALTGCRHLGDQGCWSGGGHQQMNGSLTVKVNGNNTGFTTEDNADNLDKPGGDCSGTPGNTADPACCKYSTEEKVTANIRVWIHC